MFVVIILLTLRILSVNCNLEFNDPKFPTFSDTNYDMTKMLSSASPYNIEMTCKPKKAWLIIRHGAKHPSRGLLNGIKESLVPQIQKLILDIYAKESDNNFSMLNEKRKEIIRKIKNWRNPMATGSHEDLHEYGKIQMVKLGKRWNSKLSKLTDHLTINEIEVLSSEEEICVLSGKKFLLGFYDGDQDEINISIASKGDLRLKLAKSEKDLFKVTDPLNVKTKMRVEDLYFRNNSTPMIEKIQELLFPDHVNNYQEHRKLITREMVQIIYSVCVHSFYYVNVDEMLKDAWCNLFDYADFKIFDEMGDLKFYYLNGYHLEDNPKMGNAITNDLLEFIKDSHGLKFKLFIGHTTNILSIITRFSLFKDKDRLNVDNIHQMTNRKWKSSFMTPSGSNIMFVVYDCGLNNIKVSFYLNETPLEMVMDNGSTCTECPVGDFITLLEEFNTSKLLVHSETPTKTREQIKEEITNLKTRIRELERQQTQLENLENDSLLSQKKK